MSVTNELKEGCLQGVSIACYAEPCISYGRVVHLSHRPSVCHTLALCQNDAS